MQKLNRDGVALAYREEGAGPSIVLIHGWTCNSTFFEPQLEHLSKRHRVVAVDLRGHGESDAPEDSDYAVASFADDVAWMCAQLDLERPIVIGHSMGGTIALEIAARHPDLPRAVVMLDGALFFPPEVIEGFRPVLDLLRTDQYAAVAQEFIGTSMFIAHDDQAWKQQTIDVMCRVPQHVAVPAVESIMNFDSAGAAARCMVPALYVSAEPQNADLDQFQRLCPQLMVGRTVGSGHFHCTEVPDQVNAMLDRFIAIVERGE